MSEPDLERSLRLLRRRWMQIATDAGAIVGIAMGALLSWWALIIPLTALAWDYYQSERIIRAFKRECDEVDR